MAVPATKESVGWRIGGYVNDRLVASSEGDLSFTEIWMDYIDWCQKNDGMVPITMTRFYERFEEVSRDAGITRIQKGGHVLYAGVDFIPGGKVKPVDRFTRALARDGHVLPDVPLFPEMLLASERHHGRTEEDYSLANAKRDLNRLLDKIGEKNFPPPVPDEYEGITLARAYAEG